MRKPFGNGLPGEGRWNRRGRARPSRGIAAVSVLLIVECASGWMQESAQASDNAAHDYRRAFEEIERLPSAEAAVLERDGRLPSDSELAQIVARLGPALKCLHEATAQQQCDWENEVARKGAAAEFSHLPKSRDLARRALLRARYSWRTFRRDQAIEDVRAVIVLARRVGDAGKSGLVGLTERYHIEQDVVDVLRPWMADAESARALDGLCRLALEPEENLAKVGLLAERDKLLPWLRRLVTASDLTPEEQEWRDQFCGQLLAKHSAVWIREQADQAEGRYTEVGELLELPIDQFVPKFGECLRKLDGTGNPICQVAIVECPGIPGAYLQSRNLRAQWAIVQAASLVFQRGPGAVADTSDPYGSGPFQFKPSAEGFTIRSALVIDGKPVGLSFTGVAGIQESPGGAN